MKIKVVVHGGTASEPGYQLQRAENGKILGVRPATVEEYRLYEIAKEEIRSSAKNYAARKDAEDKLAEMTKRYNALNERAESAERAADVARDALKESHKAQDALAEEFDAMEARAESAEALVADLRAASNA
jgi:predicted  nucleic acid-binding Zn-ribbon protein